MKTARSILSAFFMAASSSLLHAALPGIDNTSIPDGKPHVFSFGGHDHSEFHLDGKPLQIRAAEIHPQRIPAEYWRHRLRQAKAMGLNTISIYLMWAGFEQADGSFDFKSGSNDLAGFLQTCQEEKI